MGHQIVSRYAENIGSVTIDKCVGTPDNLVCISDHFGEPIEQMIVDSDKTEMFISYLIYNKGFDGSITHDKILVCPTTQQLYNDLNI